MIESRSIPLVGIVVGGYIFLVPILLFEDDAIRVSDIPVDLIKHAFEAGPKIGFDVFGVVPEVILLEEPVFILS